jgi:hypothetical protein
MELKGIVYCIRFQCENNTGRATFLYRALGRTLASYFARLLPRQYMAIRGMCELWPRERWHRLSLHTFKLCIMVIMVHAVNTGLLLPTPAAASQWPSRSYVFFGRPTDQPTWWPKLELLDHSTHVNCVTPYRIDSYSPNFGGLLRGETVPAWALQEVAWLQGTGRAWCLWFKAYNVSQVDSSSFASLSKSIKLSRYSKVDLKLKTTIGPLCIWIRRFLFLVIFLLQTTDINDGDKYVTETIHSSG